MGPLVTKLKKFSKASDNPEAADGEKNTVILNHRKNFKLFYQILKLVDQKTTADGTVDLPARTCRELFNAKRNAAKKSGKYVIDPNEGSPEDAVLAYCNRDTMETCIPVKSTSQLEKQKIGESDKHEYT